MSPYLAKCSYLLFRKHLYYNGRNVMGILDLYEANSACDSSLEPSPHIKNIGVQKFSRRARPQRAKMCSDHYISHLKTTV